MPGGTAPIAVFDSGLGGLSVWREIRAMLPHEPLIYFGDGKNCPYGPKTRSEVIGHVDAAARELIENQGAKMLVVACNAATAAAIRHLRETYRVPVVGMEPAVKPAALSSRTGVIGILATAGTLHGTLFQDTSARYMDKVRILSAVGEGFVELVEAGMEDTPEAVEVVRRAVGPMLEAGADRIVLGCTHYPFLAGAIRKVIGSREVELVDPAPAVARRVASLLEGGLAADADHRAEYRFMTAWDEAYLERIRVKAAQIVGG